MVSQHLVQMVGVPTAKMSLQTMRVFELIATQLCMQVAGSTLVAESNVQKSVRRPRSVQLSAQMVNAAI
jgi:hypothetical protein